MKKRSIAFIVAILVAPALFSIIVTIGWLWLTLFSFNSDDTGDVNNFILSTHQEANNNNEIGILRVAQFVIADDSKEDTTWRYVLVDEIKDCQDLKQSFPAVANSIDELNGTKLNVYKESTFLRLNPGEHVCFLINGVDVSSSELRIEENSTTYVINENDPSFSLTLIIAAITIVSLLIITAIISLIYKLYWFISTKKELVALGVEDIPSSWLLIIPFANLYYIYKYGESSQKLVGGNISGIIFVILSIFNIMEVNLNLIAIIVLQNKYNKFNDKQQIKS